MTGCAGFIGMHCIEYLTHRGHNVIGIDNVLHFTKSSINLERLKNLTTLPDFTYKNLNINSREELTKLFCQVKPDLVLHLQVQDEFKQYETTSFCNVLEACQAAGTVKHIVFASSSIVYAETCLSGTIQSEDQILGVPLDYYAASKVAQEHIANIFAKKNNISITALRYFNIHGPWIRKGLLLSQILKSVNTKQALEISYQGLTFRDYTHVRDAAIATVKVLEKPSLYVTGQPFKILNIGTGVGTTVNQYLKIAERVSGISLPKTYVNNSDVEIKSAVADVSELYNWTQYIPMTTVEQTLSETFDWYKTQEKMYFL